MDVNTFSEIKEWFLYKIFPSKIKNRESKKNFKKKMKKYKYEEESDLLFYHINNEVCFIVFVFVCKLFIYLFNKGEPDYKRVLHEEEVPELLELFHYSDEKGGHSGRDAMIYKISMYFNCC